MGNLKVGMRLALAFGLLLVLMTLACLLALMGLRGAEEQASALERENVALLNAVHAMRVAQLNEAVAVRDFVGTPDVDSQRLAANALKESEKSYTAAVADLARVAQSMQAERGVVQQVEKLKAASVQVSRRVHDALDQWDIAEYDEAQKIVYGDVRKLQAAIASDLRGLVDHANALVKQRARLAREEAQASVLRLTGLLVVALALGAVATVVITRGIVRPLVVAADAAERVAGGDLRPLEVRAGRDETGRLLAALADMQQRLNALVRGIQGSAEAVGRSSEQIGTGNTELAARTEEQAAALEETAAGIEQLTASVKQNSAHAAKGRELARQAAELAGGGGAAVADVRTTMQGIQKSSRRVSDIVGLMDELAFQTNLLALNAAVEAARAGEHGRGFAVVAQQVRVLAQRSAEASKDIRQLASEAVEQADAGAKTATRAGETMEKVVRVARDVAEVVAEIAKASDEQRIGIEQVNTTVTQLDAATQSNAGLVQEITTITDALLAGSRDLSAAAARFRLDDRVLAEGVAHHASGSERALGAPWLAEAPALN